MKLKVMKPTDIIVEHGLKKSNGPNNSRLKLKQNLNCLFVKLFKDE